MQELSYRLLDYFEQLGTLAEALELVSQRHEIVDAPDAQPLVVREGAIRYENISFAHPDGLQVFDDLNLIIRPGEKVGLVGPSGAGKSTLVKLLRRQFEPQAGRILIDNQDIAHVTWDSLNEAIAEVPQVPGIFHRAVRDNIRYAKPGADEAEVLRAAAEAYAHDFIVGRRTATTPSSASRASSSPAASVSASPSRAPWSRTRASWCWTKPPRRSIPNPSI